MNVRTHSSGSESGATEQVSETRATDDPSATALTQLLPESVDSGSFDRKSEGSDDTKDASATGRDGVAEYNPKPLIRSNATVSLTCEENSDYVDECDKSSDIDIPVNDLGYYDSDGNYVDTYESIDEFMGDEFDYRDERLSEDPSVNCSAVARPHGTNGSFNPDTDTESDDEQRGYSTSSSGDTSSGEESGFASSINLQRKPYGKIYRKFFGYDRYSKFQTAVQDNIPHIPTDADLPRADAGTPTQVRKYRMGNSRTRIASGQGNTPSCGGPLQTITQHEKRETLRSGKLPPQHSIRQVSSKMHNLRLKGRYQPLDIRETPSTETRRQQKQQDRKPGCANDHGGNDPDGNQQVSTWLYPDASEKNPRLHDDDSKGDPCPQEKVERYILHWPGNPQLNFNRCKLVFEEHTKAAPVQTTAVVYIRPDQLSQDLFDRLAF